jgi:5-dehydro-4-deoxyglucarate dehydratase
MTPQELKHVLQAGLLSFPLTDFDTALRFAAGGTGEFFSLEPREFLDVIRVALDACRGRTPIVAGAGGGTTLAIQYAQEAERLGAQGILLLPHYLTEASQKGLVAHIEAVCRSVRIGVIVYNRGGCRLTPASLQVLEKSCPNLVGFKDGVGDIEKLVAVRQTLGNRFAYLGGPPTAEVFAGAYKAMGCPVYSSAVFNFAPRMAMTFYAAHAAGDAATCNRLVRDFFPPYIALRNRGEGYAVSIVKAGATIVGHSAGPVRPPLSDLEADEFEPLRALIATLGPQ